MRLGIADEAVALGGVRRSGCLCRIVELRMALERCVCYVMRIKERGEVENDILRAEWRSDVVEKIFITAKCGLGGF